MHLVINMETNFAHIYEFEDQQVCLLKTYGTTCDDDGDYEEEPEYEISILTGETASITFTFPTEEKRNTAWEKLVDPVLGLNSVSDIMNVMLTKNKEH